MINDENLVNNGLKIYADGTCANNGLNTWSYNQGVILGGLVELYKATGDSSLLSKAASIAEAAISALSINGILHESCESDDCGADVSQFKGMDTGHVLELASPEITYLLQKADVQQVSLFAISKYFQQEVERADFRAFILNNANSIWADDRNDSGYLGLNWAGPPSVGGGPNASTHSSATDALVAAMAVF